MVTPELQNYVEQSFAAGKTKEQIASDLRMAGGWQQSDIDEVFAVLQKPPYAKNNPIKVCFVFYRSSCYRIDHRSNSICCRKKLMRQ